MTRECALAFADGFVLGVMACGIGVMFGVIVAAYWRRRRSI